MKNIIVQKFGGTSVGSVERILAVANIIKAAYKNEFPVVVVSAMGKETDRLVMLAKGISKNPEKRELDALLSTCLLYTSPSPRDLSTSRMPSSA